MFAKTIGKLILPAKILSGVFLALSLFCQILMLSAENVDILYNFPQTLFGLFSFAAVLSAFYLTPVFIPAAIVWFVSVSALYLIQILYGRIRSAAVRMISSVMLILLLICDVIVLVGMQKVGGLVVPLITDVLAILTTALILAGELTKKGEK